MGDRDLSALETALGYQFQSRGQLVTALTHRSFANENRDVDSGDNERLEFLGDAVLGLVVGHLLMEQRPELNEGQLSIARAQAVSEPGLAEVARSLDLGKWLRVGRGEERTGGRDKPSLLADAFEAVVAAVYLDGGFECARQLVSRLFSPRIAAVDLATVADYKTRLQEASQADLKETPEYRVVASSGPDHDKTFEVAVHIGEREWARAAGKSKKEAEQLAAQKAYGELVEDGGDP